MNNDNDIDIPIIQTTQTLETIPSSNGSQSGYGGPGYGHGGHGYGSNKTSTSRPPKYSIHSNVDDNLNLLGKKLPPHILHLIRLNRTAPLYHDGVDQADNPIVFWAHDAIIELLQKYFHKHNKENTIESWIKNSHILCS